MQNNSSIFISYSRANVDFARDLYDKLTALGFRLWRDRSEMEAGEDWWQQIQEAIRAVDTMVLVLSPAALASPVVTREWRYARQVGTRVIPVIGANVDFNSVPRWAGKLDWLDFREGAPEAELIWSKFTNQLKATYQRVRVPFTAPDVSERYVQRPTEFNAVIDLLLDKTHENPLATTAILKGGGGFGKSALAGSICHDERIQAAFDGGILWVTLGETPDLIGLVTDQIKLLSGDTTNYADLITAMARFKELLAERDMLIVIDDVWDESHAKPFMNGGPNCARLITTRRQDVITRIGGKAIEINQMKPSESARLLIGWMPQLPADLRPFETLAHDLGDWPLLLWLAGAYLREAVLIDQQSISDALGGLRRRLDKRGFTAFDRADEGQRNNAVRISLDLSINKLGKWRDRYLELAVFPEDRFVPFSLIERLWATTAGLDDLDTEDALKAIQRLSLFNDYDPIRKTIQLHDVVRAYLAAQHGDKLPELHSRLLDSYKVTRWAELPDKAYLWAELAYHLKEANRVPELIDTMKDLMYLAKKTYTQNAYAAELDLLAAQQEAPDDAVLRNLRRHFANMGHLLNRLDSVNDIAATIYSRLRHNKELAALCENLEHDLTKPYLTAWHRLPDFPHPSLIRTMNGHLDNVMACAISPNSDFIVSASRDNTLKVWDTKTGAIRLTLTGHTAWVTGCAITPSGNFIVSAAGDGIRVWDAKTGAEQTEQRNYALILAVGRGEMRVNTCAVTDDYIVAAAPGKTLHVWDFASGEERFLLDGHTGRVNDCAANDDIIVSASSDNTLKVWDAKTGAERFTLQGHSRRVNACAISPDGTLIVSASLDETLKVWDAKTGENRLTLRGNRGEVTDCAISNHGDLIVSASWDGTLRIWNMQSETEKLALTGHTHRINACAISPDSDLIVSASNDGTLRVWDGRTIKLAAQIGLGTMLSVTSSGEVRDCAINATGELAVSASSGNTLKLWDTATGEEKISFNGLRGVVGGPDNEAVHLSNCAISPAGDFVVYTADNSLGVWDIETKSLRFTRKSLGPEDMNGCAISPDGRWIVAASDDSLLRLWDAQTGEKPFNLEGHRDGVETCTFSPEGNFIVSASYDTTLKTWDTKTGAIRLTLRGHTDVVRSCAVSPDGTWIVSAARDNTLKTWDAHTGTERLTLRGHTNDVRGCAISPTGDWIVSASRDETLRIWDAQTGECRAVLAVNGRLFACAVHPDGEHIIAAGSGGLYFLEYVI